MPGEISVAFVGCGGMAARYVNVYRELDGVRLACCIDVNLESAQRAAAGAAATTDFCAALQPDIDALIVNTPNSLHRKHAVAALEAGKHLLLQKPVAANLADAEAIEQVAARSTRTAGLYMSYFDQPLMHDLRDMVSQGRLGDIVHCYARLMHTGGMMWSMEALSGTPNWRASLEQTGGGCFIQLGVHYIHLFEWITGARVRRVTGATRRLHCPGLEGEDLASALLELDSGAIITLDMAWCARGEELSVHGTRGRFNYRESQWLSIASSAGSFRGRVVEYSAGLIDAFGGAQGEERQFEIHPPAFGDAANPFNQHRAFVEAARDGRPSPVSIASGVRDLRVVAAVYEAARAGRTVEVQ